MNKQGIHQLRKIILEDEVVRRETIEKELADLFEELKDKEKLSTHVGPIIQERLEDLKNRFPEIYGDVITETIKKQIADSQDEVVEALYPIIGQLTKKYIRKEIELLAEKIEKQLDENLSVNTWLRRVKSWFGRVDEAEMIITSSIPPSIEDVFVIENESGLLLASFSKSGTVDQDMVAAMLTAIKSFVEDAFQNKDQNLEWIEYETYKLHISTFVHHSIAVTISGIPSKEFKQKLDDLILTYVEKVLKKLPKTEHVQENEELNNQLMTYFSL